MNAAPREDQGITHDAWLSVAEASLLAGLSDRHVRRLARKERLESRRTPLGRNANAIEIRLSSLGPAAEAKYLRLHPELTRPEAGDSNDTASVQKMARRYADAPESVRRRADLRLEAVLSWRRAEAEARRTSSPLCEARRQWLQSFRRKHPAFHVSLASVRRWETAYRADGLDGLVDGNDGSARSGKVTISEELQRDFRALYLRPTRPTISYCYRQLQRAATVSGEVLPAYDAFRRLAESIPPAVAAMFREEADSEIRPFVQRDYETERAMRTIQSDHHQIDVAVHCGDPLCDRGHYPWWTVWFDMRSRKVLGSDLYIDHPNSRRILGTFKRVLQQHGLCEVAYIDNGLDYKKSFGWGVRHRTPGRKTADFQPMPDWTEERLASRLAPIGVTPKFAKPYNAQAKPIERMFRTNLERLYRGYESYRGELGRRSERAEYLRKNPSELPLISELMLALERETAEYNAAPHSGQGMSGKSPDEVFEATRLPRRDVDPMAFSLVFYDVESRKVHKNGIRFKPKGSAHESRDYRIDELAVQTNWFGRRVLVWFDEEDLSELVVTDEERRFLSLARPREFATHNTADEQTKQVIGSTAREWSAIKRLIRQENPQAAKHLERVAASVEEYHRVREAAMPAAIAVGAERVVNLLPHESKLSRAIGAARERVRSRAGVLHISSADLELARQVEGPTDEQLADFARRSAFALSEPYHKVGRGEESERVETPDNDFAERQRERRLEAKVDSGLCGFDLECEGAAFANYLCEKHWTELYARD